MQENMSVCPTVFVNKYFTSKQNSEEISTYYIDTLWHCSEHKWND